MWARARLDSDLLAGSWLVEECFLFVVAAAERYEDCTGEHDQQCKGASDQTVLAGEGKDWGALGCGSRNGDCGDVVIIFVTCSAVEYSVGENI